MLMRRKSAKRMPEAFVEAGYVIERLFRIIEDLLEKVQPEPGQQGVKQGESEKLKRLFYRHMGHTDSGRQKEIAIAPERSYSAIASERSGS